MLRTHYKCGNQLYSVLIVWLPWETLNLSVPLRDVTDLPQSQWDCVWATTKNLEPMISLTSLVILHSSHWFPFLLKSWEATSNLNCLANSHIFLIIFLFNEFEVPRAEATTSLQITKLPILSCIWAWNNNCLWISSIYCEWGVPRNTIEGFLRLMIGPLGSSPNCSLIMGLVG